MIASPEKTARLVRGDLFVIGRLDGLPGEQAIDLACVP